jgi:putative transposase
MTTFRSSAERRSVTPTTGRHSRKCVVALGDRHRRHEASARAGGGFDGEHQLVTDLLTGLRDRGLDTTRAIIPGIDGGKALRAAVVRVFDHPVIQRCQPHKVRNVADKLPDHLPSAITKRMRAAYRAESAILAEAQLETLAKELQRTHPGAAGSLREGLSETLTCYASASRRRWPARCARPTASSR